MLQDPAHRVRGLGLPPVGVSDQFPAASQQVRQAALVGRMDEAAIRRPAVPLDRPGVVGAQHRHGVEVATPTGDAVDGDALADEDPQPRLGAADPPAGLIRGDHGAGPHALGQGLVGQLACPAGAGDRLDDPTGGDAQPQLAEQPGDLACRHAQPLAEPRGQRHRPGTNLRPGRPEGVGGLAGMAGLDPAAAPTAAADLELLAGHQRRGGRQVLDVLHRHPLQRQRTAAVGTARRQPHHDDLVGDGPVGVATVGRTRLAARAPG